MAPNPQPAEHAVSGNKNRRAWMKLISCVHLKFTIPRQVNTNYSN